jgi:hypothetical protein
LKEIIIRLGKGTIRSGFSTITIELKAGTTQWVDESILPPNPELHELLNKWQLLYPAAIRLPSSGMNLSPPTTLSPPEPTFETDTVTNVSSQGMVELNHRLRATINDWLNFGDFGRISRRLRKDLNISDRVLVIIISEQLKVWQLPWHFWDLFTDYPQAVEVFSKPSFVNVRHIKPQCNARVNILALSGRDPAAKINLDFLKTLPKCRHEVDNKATSAAEVATRLEKFKPDLFIFYGHGDTIQYESFQEGIIYLDNNTPIQISTLRAELQRAIDRGLQIAIFNCCNGLGLAEQIADLNIPYIIVMREVIPNQTAQGFLENLLLQYSQGETFPAAFNYARQQLRLGSGGFAQFADWLPILFHNPLSDSVTWQDLSATVFSRLIPPQLAKVCHVLNQPKYRIWKSVGLSTLGSLLALSLQAHPQIARWENTLIDRIQANQVEKMPSSPSKVTIVNYDEVTMGGLVPNDNLLRRSIEQVEKIAKPTIWAIDVNFNDDSTMFDKHIIQGCNQKVPNTSNINNYFQLDPCDRQLVEKAVKLSLDKPVSQDFRLNPNLLIGNNARIDRVNLSDLLNGSKSQTEIKRLFDGKSVLVGYSDRQEINSVGRVAISIDQIFRTNDRQQSLWFFNSQSIGEQLLWIFSWSVLTGIWACNRRWKLLCLSAIGGEIAIGGALFILGQGIPIMVTPIAMSLVGFTVRAITTVNSDLIDRQSL